MSKLTKWTTPAGIAVWPRLSEPSTRFVADGVYECGLRYSGAEATRVIASIKQYAKEGYEQLCRELGKSKLKIGPMPYSEEEDGSIVVKTKLKAKITKKDGGVIVQRPAVFDARGNLIKADLVPKIGGGSVLKACCEVFPFFMATSGYGISLRLRAVQLIKLVEYVDGGDAKSLGFTTEEEGYVHGESFEQEVATASEQPAAKVESADKDEDIPF